jgi:m7GpppX diphosphatase
LKLTLIYPCNDKHIKKYTPQGVRLVTETPEIYQKYIRPYMERQRDRLAWVFNIIEGRSEQDSVLYREHGDEGFLVTPDLSVSTVQVATDEDADIVVATGMARQC